MKAKNEFSDIEFVPIVRARAVPGGSIERPFYDKVKAEILKGVSSTKFDGIFLHLHGSTHVEGPMWKVWKMQKAISLNRFEAQWAKNACSLRATIFMEMCQNVFLTTLIFSQRPIKKRH